MAKARQKEQTAITMKNEKLKIKNGKQTLKEENKTDQLLTKLSQPLLKTALSLADSTGEEE